MQHGFKYRVNPADYKGFLLRRNMFRVGGLKRAGPRSGTPVAGKKASSAVPRIKTGWAWNFPGRIDASSIGIHATRVTVGHHFVHDARHLDRITPGLRNQLSHQVFIDGHRAIGTGHDRVAPVVNLEAFGDQVKGLFAVPEIRKSPFAQVEDPRALKPRDIRGATVGGF